MRQGTRRGAGWLTVGLGLAGAATLAACAPSDGATTAEKRAAASRNLSNVEFVGVSTRMMDRDLVNLRVGTRGSRDGALAEAYARCAAAQYALIRGYGFARHVRTNLSKDGGIWTADAVYTISPGYPAGAVALNAGDVVADCNRDGIPTV